ncbi:MAG: adenylosuccinate synthase [Bacteroidota bacterium]
MKADVLLGLQWGDEGKGKIVDVIAPKYDIVARFQGGPNAGHTIEFNNQKHVLHIIPSGIFHEHIVNIIGNGVVIDPIVLSQEIDMLEKLGVNVKTHLFLSRRAHLILPTHRLLDAANEAAKGTNKIGSTLRGITPTYVDKTGRNGLRIGDIFSAEGGPSGFKKKYDFLVSKHKQILSLYDFPYNLNELEEKWFEGIEVIRTLKAIDSEIYINEAFLNNKTVLAEGAQGSLLDIDFGTYPFVTSSNTICAGACIGLGIPPSRIGNVIGIFKAYSTRVGSGPFPTELNDEIGEAIQKNGNEFGSTTGRPRRCGWLDIPLLKYAITINGVNKLIIMKVDVLSNLDTIKVCTHYNYEDRKIDFLPYNITQSLTPLYKDFKGWKSDLKKISTTKNIPTELENYIHFIEQKVNVPVNMISFGPDRKQILERNKVLM